MNGMNLISMGIKDLWILEPHVFNDGRGYFYETWQRPRFEENGLFYDFVQDNESMSCKGTVRGLHFQCGEHAQAKLVRVLVGAVLDVAVDLRPDSPTFGKHAAVELSGDNRRQFMIPRGFAHGFSVLSDTAVFAYKCDNIYCHEAERGIRFDDPDLAIDWCLGGISPVLSEKDKKWPLFKEFTQCF